MASLKASSKKRYIIALQAAIITQIDFDPVGQEYPNIFQMFNYGLQSVYFGINPNLTISGGYEGQIAGGAITIYANPDAPSHLFLYSTVACNVVINAWVSDGPISTAELSQTINSTIINSTTTSVVTLGASLPTGANTIGNVGINAGSNNIGKINNADFPSGVPTLYNVTLAAITTEYSQAFTNAKKIVFKVRGGLGSDTLYTAWVTGKVAGPTAPYETWAQNQAIIFEDLNIASGALYFATSKAGVVVEMEVWQ